MVVLTNAYLRGRRQADLAKEHGISYSRVNSITTQARGLVVHANDPVRVWMETEIMRGFDIEEHEQI